MEETLGGVVLPCLDGRYPKIAPVGALRVWLGGVVPAIMVLTECDRRPGKYRITGAIKATRESRAYPFHAEGQFHHEGQFLVSLISTVARSIPAILPDSDIERDRLIDFLFDQLVEKWPEDWPRLSCNPYGGRWLTPSQQDRMRLRHEGQRLCYYGEIASHPFLPMVYALSPGAVSRVCYGSGRIMPKAMSDQMACDPLLVVDVKKPEKRIHLPITEGCGAVITGARAGLEAWAREMALQQRRPLIVIKTKQDVRRLGHMLQRATVVVPPKANAEALGHIRAQLVESAR